MDVSPIDYSGKWRFYRSVLPLSKKWTETKKTADVISSLMTIYHVYLQNLSPSYLFVVYSTCSIGHLKPAVFKAYQAWGDYSLGSSLQCYL